MVFILNNIFRLFIIIYLLCKISRQTKVQNYIFDLLIDFIIINRMSKISLYLITGNVDSL